MAFLAPMQLTRSVGAAPLQRVHGRQAKRASKGPAFGATQVALVACRRALRRAKDREEVTEEVTEEVKEVSWDAQLLLGALRLYRQVVSPLMPPNCRYAPSCSRLLGGYSFSQLDAR